MEFRILGSLEVWAGERQVPITGARLRRLLAALLLDARRLITTEHIIDILWDGEPPPTAREQVHNTVSALRRALSGTTAALVTDHTGYRLDVAATHIDAGVFVERVHQAQRLADAGDTAAAGDLIGGALTLWRAPALTDVDSRALDPAVLRLNEAHLAAVNRHAEWRLACGRHQEVAVDLADWVADHPFREDLVAALMVSLYRGGRQVDALEAFDRLRARLRDDFGVDPGAAILALRTAILRRDSTLNPPQQRSSGTPKPEPMIVPAQLPGEADGFQGRASHLAWLDAIAGRLGSPDGTAGVVAIVGSPGVGKTALAVHWARRARHRFPDGQLWINLRGFTAGAPLPPVDALARFLRALGLPAERVPVEVDEAAALFRTIVADRRLLIILDNAHDAGQVRPLLPGGSATLVIVTSRDRLSGLVAMHGADRVRLDLLDPAEARALVVRLFGDARPGTTDREAGDLADVCVRLPLALRIAAANLRDQPEMTVAAYLEKLQADVLTGLTIDGDEPVAVRAAFNHSYQALDVESRRLFRLVGTAPVLDVAVSAAAALTDTTPENATATLRHLADAHLIDEPVPGRFELHDLLRAFACDQVGDDADEGAITRLYANRLHAVDSAATALYPHIARLPVPLPSLPPSSASITFASAREAGAWLDAERANLASLVSRADAQRTGRMAWLIADAMRGYFLQNRFNTEWADIGRAALAVAAAHDAADGQAAAHQSLGNLHRGLGDYEAAADHHERALDFARRAEWDAGQAAAHNGLGSIRWYQGRLPETLAHYTAALAINRRIGRTSGLANELSNVGVVMSDLGQLAEAAEHQRDALVMHRAAGNRASAANALLNLSEIQRMRGYADEAASTLTEALELGRDAGSLDLEACSLDALAALHRDLNDLPRAAEYGREALSVAVRTSHPRTEASAIATLATIACAQGDYETAAAEATRSLALARSAGDRFSEVRAQIALASAQAGRGDVADAGATVAEALTKARAIGYGVLEIDAMIVELQVTMPVGTDFPAGADAILVACERTGYGLGADRLRELVRLHAPAPRRDRR